MSDFENAFRKTLAERTHVQGQLAQADKDLHEVCLKASEAIQKLTDGKAQLELAPITPRNAMLAYALDFVTADENRTLRVFALNSGGYPIQVFRSLEKWNQKVAINVVSSLKELENRQELELAINSLAGKESELIPLVEFVIRNRSEPVGHSKSTI